MGNRTTGRHLDDARLHAYAADEVDPAHRAVIEAHLDSCDRCRDAFGRVCAVLGLIQRIQPRSPDELTWRRMQERVRARLEEDAKVDGLTTMDLFMGRRWVTAGVAAVAAVALLVWFAPARNQSRTPQRPIPVAVDDVPKSQIVTTADAPLDVKLALGVEIRLAKHTRVVAPPTGADYDLDLKLGGLDVRLTERPAADQPFTIRTPAFMTYARSRDFSVGYRANRYLVAVRDGEVDVDGEAFGGRETVSQGEEREVRMEPKKPARVIRKATAPAKMAVDVEPEVVTRSSEGETSVQVLAPDDPTIAAWARANRAYYKDGDLEAAIQHAQIVAADATDRPEARLARRMICDARIALAQPKEAIDACGALLDGERSDDEVRTVRYMLGTIYRTQLGDCRRANEQYEAVLAYGRSTLLDDEARLFRAGCALDLGDLAIAQQDIRVLAPHAGRLSRPAELRALQQRLQSALSAQEGINEAEGK